MSSQMSQNTKQKVQRLVTKYSEFKPTAENIKFFNPRENQAGGLNVGFNYNDSPLYVQTQRLKNPFGFSRGRPGKPEYNKKFTCTLSFDQSNPKGCKFLQAMKDLEEVIIDEAMKEDNLVKWRLYANKKEAKTATRDTVRQKFKHMVKIPTDEDGNEVDTYPPTFRVNFNTDTIKEKDPDTGVEVDVLKITSEVYDEAGNRLREINEETIPKYSEARTIMYARSVWSTAGNFGVTWRIHQIRVYPGDYVPAGVLLITDEDSDNEEAEGDNSPATQLLNDSDDGEGDEDEGEDEDTPKPTLKSARRRKVGA